jgi:uncharacterized protein
MVYHHLYLLYLYHFNVRRDYYECHDVLEELWLDEQRDLFYQGLIQAAVGLYHFRWDNVKGSILLFEGAVSKLKPHEPVHKGIHVYQLRLDAEAYLRRLYCYDEQPFPFYDLNIEIVDDELRALIDEIDKEMRLSKE